MGLWLSAILPLSQQTSLGRAAASGIISPFGIFHPFLAAYITQWTTVITNKLNVDIYTELDVHLGNAGEILRGLKLILYTPKYVWSDSKAKLAYTVFGVAKILCKVTQVVLDTYVKWDDYMEIASEKVEQGKRDLTNVSRPRRPRLPHPPTPVLMSTVTRRRRRRSYWRLLITSSGWLRCAVGMSVSVRVPWLCWPRTLVARISSTSSCE